MCVFIDIFIVKKRKKCNFLVDIIIFNFIYYVYIINYYTWNKKCVNI